MRFLALAPQLENALLLKLPKQSSRRIQAQAELSRHLTSREHTVADTCQG
jgi:hypothetical protein